MAKKYLTLDEAAARLSMSKDELVKMRERGDIRGFADRGNWKFKVDDIEEVARNRSADSDPDVPILADSADSGFLDETGDSSIVLGGEESGPLSDSAEQEAFGEGLQATDSDVRLVMDDEIAPAAEAAGGGLLPAEDSDSDINLVAGGPDSDSDVMLVGGGSDIVGSPDPRGRFADSESDVKLVDAQESDSDVKLVDSDSDSDVKLADSGDSDSDIQLAPVDDAAAGFDEATDSDLRLGGDDLGGTDSDVRLVADDAGSDISLASDLGSDSEVRLVADPLDAGSDSDVQLIDSSMDARTSDSDIALLSSDDSAISLDLGDADESGSVLADEGGSGLGEGSSITLASESGISLEGPTDSGISLDLDGDEGITLADEGDSGISLGEAGDSGIALAPGDHDFGGTMPMMDAVADDDVAETQFELPSLSSDDGDTGIIDLEDESGELDDAVFDVDDGDSAEIDGLSDELELDDEFDDEGGMEELDVFEDDTDFEEGFQSGESQGELVIPTRAAAVEAEWSTGTFVSLIASTTLLFVLGIVMADLVRSMWAWNEPNMVAGPLLDIFGGLF